MCGHDISDKPRGGALAVLSPTTPSPGPNRDHLPPCRGDLAFHTPGSPSSKIATHARWTRTPGDDVSCVEDLLVVIHESGDLTHKPEDCGLFRQFAFSRNTASVIGNGQALEIPLAPPISLEVGRHGIIGRRVSLFHNLHNLTDSSFSTTRMSVAAEGIVGFNFVLPVSSSL
ncbi:hypothetical protein SODALDRAFT_321537 [Sodiomyces alkalinus F11]|uniref:Uncharacterized protein n=1 Tax=Sodiomyces alkalinus (strain CBS 110278 / VKM F-3762 / F11) TaxID=1314773 RepID=A0A3N2PJC9_SODAK|nr:hypothetical protein SODALDRAFT_321537 [Sodiomyces alkalinus F11]ROT34540.1 hypothetical protein SODALDRAFT_321537 [Sodiomyces alkalinus F11]